MRLENEAHESPGHDSIGTKIIHLCSDTFAENLSKIFNNAILQGVYPDAMKIAKVIALFKGGIKRNPNNYRPITFVSHFDKKFEKNLCKRLNKYHSATNTDFENCILQQLR